MTQEGFDRLLDWLGKGDREAGAQKYEDIRHGLIKVFRNRLCQWNEELADEVINRVVKKVDQVAGSYDDNDPALYFYGVARVVYKEHVSKPLPPVPPLPPPPSPTPLWECLEQCFEQLGPRSEELVVDYYAERGKAKIKQHQQMADRLGITVNALRIRVHRLRESLRDCVARCYPEIGEY